MGLLHAQPVQLNPPRAAHPLEKPVNLHRTERGKRMTISKSDSCRTRKLYPAARFLLLAVLAALLLTAATACGNRQGESLEELDWDHLDLSSYLPKPETGTVKVFFNTEDLLSYNVYGVTDEYFSQYWAECEAAGFTVGEETVDGALHSFNETGFELNLSILKDWDGAMGIILIRHEDPVDPWPEKGLGSLVPAPASLSGTVTEDYDNVFSAVIADTDEAGADAYAELCREAGFTEETADEQAAFSARNADGVRVRISCEAGNTMFVRVNTADDEESSSSSGSASSASGS